MCVVHIQAAASTTSIFEIIIACFLSGWLLQLSKLKCLAFRLIIFPNIPLYTMTVSSVRQIFFLVFWHLSTGAFLNNFLDMFRNFSGKTKGLFMNFVDYTALSTSFCPSNRLHLERSCFSNPSICFSVSESYPQHSSFHCCLQKTFYASLVHQNASAI